MKINKRGKRRYIILATLLIMQSSNVYSSQGTTWDAIPFKPYTVDQENEVIHDSLQEKLMQRLMSKRQSRYSNGHGSKISNVSSEQKEPNRVYGDVVSYLNSEYPGLFPAGLKALSPHIIAFDEYTNKYSSQFGVDPGLMRALMSRESFNGNVTSGAAWGPAQIEYTLDKEFKKFGEEYFGIPFQITKNKNTDHRAIPEYNIAFGCYRFAQQMEIYDGDYAKAIQAYNFSHFSLNILIQKFPGKEWLKQRPYMGKYNGTKKPAYGQYGDCNYIEEVMKFYNG